MLDTGPNVALRILTKKGAAEAAPFLSILLQDILCRRVNA